MGPLVLGRGKLPFGVAVVFTIAMLVVVLGAVAISGRGAAAAPPSPRTLSYEVTVPGVGSADVQLPVMVYLPASVASAGAQQALQVVVAVHGYGGNGRAMGEPLIPYAEQNGWVLVAPTFPYREWHDPENIRKDDTEFLPGLKQIVDGLSARTGLQLKPRVLLYGFSRGAQAVHRFAFAYPESVEGVATISAGTYTLPKTTWTDSANESQTLVYPFGVADLAKFCGKPFDLAAVRRIPFLVGVGAKDHQVSDVPRNWDKYIGDCRVDRAEAFTESLRNLGATVREVEFSNTDHKETPEIRDTAMAFLRGISPRD
ncbi:MAG: alpha/beta hydrolase [Chloroflexota bacterium]